MRTQRRILVIDDSPEDREAFRRFLRQDAEYQNLVQEAATGEEGLEACRRGGFDAVLLDQHMPRMEGMQVLRLLRAQPGWSTPVIALTSTGRADVARQMLEAGAHDFLFKEDITASILSRTITHAITRERLQRKVAQAARRSAQLQQITAELSRALTPRQVLDVFLQLGLEALGAQAGFVALLSADGTSLEVDTSPGFSSDAVRPWQRIPLSASLPITDAVRTGALVTIGTLEEKYARYPALQGANPSYPALAASSLRAAGKRLGGLGIAYSEPHTFDEEECTFLLVLSRQCAEALERARLYEALQESEAQRHLALEAAQLGTLSWELDSRLFEMDAACRALYGFPPELRLTSERVTERVHPEDRPRLQEWFQALRLPGASSEYDVKYRVLLEDGRVRWLLSRGRAVRDAQGRAVRLMGINHDITQLVLQKEAEQRRADFEQKLVGIVSHDLKNPLSAILMQSAMAVQQGGLDERVLKMMKRIQSSAERASRMIFDLLDFTQARLGGGIPVQRRHVEAREVVAQVMEEARQAFPHRTLRFTASGETAGQWDGDRLAQVVTNLVQNALKYSPEDSEVHVELRSQGESVELSVHNQGTPISAERLPVLFEPLQRATSQEDKQSRSVGLGLYIVKQLVEAHEGTISVRSDASAGTVFTVRLPRQPRSPSP
jgi:PAS domain S-box-containing protein